MKDQNLSEKFIRIYNELDGFMRKYLRVEDFVEHSSLLRMMADKNRIFSSYYRDLKTFADLRNLLVHNPYKGEADPLLIPHEYIVRKYEEIKNSVLKPKKALSIAVPRSKIFITTLEENAVDVMQIMNSMTFTHIPVIDGDRMIGVFSENTILSYLTHNKEGLITNEAKIKDFRDFIPFDKHASEYFEFIGRDALLSDVEDMFRLGLRERRRIAVIFVTETGKSTEKFLGMITAWDVAGSE